MFYFKYFYVNRHLFCCRKWKSRNAANFNEVTPCTAPGVLNFYKFVFMFLLFLHPFFFLPLSMFEFLIFACFLLSTYITFCPKIFCDRIISTFFVPCSFIRSDVMWYLWGCFIRNVCKGKTKTQTTTLPPQHLHTRGTILNYLATRIGNIQTRISKGS